MNCIEFKKHVNELIDDEIDLKLKYDMESHMENCTSCKNEYNDIKFIVENLRNDGASMNLSEKQRKGIKEIILKSPVKKHRGLTGVLRNLSYAAAIFMFLTVGIHFAGGVNVNIGPTQSSANPLQTEVDKLKGEVDELKKENDRLKSNIKDLELTKTNNDWIMINPNIGEAIIEGLVTSVDLKGKKVKLEVYKDDNTPDIDPNVNIPDNIMITKSSIGGELGAQTQGTINDLKAGDHIIIHYIEKLKAARAVIIYEK